MAMTIEANKDLVRRFYEELWNRGNLAAAEELVAQDYVRHDLRPGAAPPGPAGQQAIAQRFRTAFPDIRLEVEAVVAEGDLVVARWTIWGHTRVPGRTYQRQTGPCPSPA
jgi:predicted SnoaL-like aldol condensation-catalyzing enzyme